VGVEEGNVLRDSQCEQERETGALAGAAVPRIPGVSSVHRLEN